MDFDQTQMEHLHVLRQEHIGRLLQQAARQFTQQAITMLQQRGHHGLTPAHVQLLSNLDIEGTRISVLAERASITKQSMGQLVVELEKQGYIERRDDPTDRRACLVLFTALGWQFLRDAYVMWQEIETDYQKVIGKEQMEQLHSALKQILQHTTQKEI